MSYLYSKLPETGVPPHIGTGGTYAIASGAGALESLAEDARAAGVELA